MHKSFVYDRTIHFQDTDAAGVVYFANGLSLCHEAYEASLAVPITHASIDFFKPMFCGDRVMISLTPSLLTSASFQIKYELYFEVTDSEKKAIAKALTKHICIDPNTRKHCELSADLLKWLDVSTQ